jgi:hypothetical protein
LGRKLTSLRIELDITLPIIQASYSAYVRTDSLFDNMVHFFSAIGSPLNRRLGPMSSRLLRALCEAKLVADEESAASLRTATSIVKTRNDGYVREYELEQKLLGDARKEVARLCRQALALEQQYVCLPNPLPAAAPAAAAAGSMPTADAIAASAGSAAAVSLAADTGACSSGRRCRAALAA